MIALFVACVVLGHVTGTEKLGGLRHCMSDEIGCFCKKSSDCIDYTREKYGICDPRTEKCIYCLHGEYITENSTHTFYVSSDRNCFKSDSCNQTYTIHGIRIEVECVDSYCIRDGYETDEVCSCRSGFLAKQMWDRKARCVDDNECEGIARQDCGTLHCINTIGSYKCGCRTGYRLVNEDHCEEIDECTEVIGLCPQSCHNIPGAYNCTCHTGYMQMMKNGKAICVDIDECQLNPCIPLSTCYNTVGSYFCVPPIPAPTILVTWSGTIIPIIVVIVILVLVYKVRKLRRKVIKLSHEDLLENGRYNVSAKTENTENRPMLKPATSEPKAEV